MGDGQVDFKSIFSKLSAYGFDGWAVLEWECCIKSPEQGATEGAPFIANHIIDVTTKAFDDFELLVFHNWLWRIFELQRVTIPHFNPLNNSF